MVNLKIHIFGASGSGVSTLGKALALKLNYPFFDADDFYWQKTDPPFVNANPIEERKLLLKNALTQYDRWILSGSLVSWGDLVEDQFDLAVYLWVPPEERVHRVKIRERERFGDRISPGGDMYENHQKFLDWVAQYDEGLLGGRSKARHEKWLQTLKCPVLRLRGSMSTDRALDMVLKSISN